MPWAAGGFKLVSNPSAAPSIGTYAGLWVAHTFVEQSFAVVWSAGLLIVARDYFNTKPGRLGRVIIGAAYTVYIIHPMYVTLFGRALYAAPPTMTLVANALAISPMVVTASWLTAAAIKAIPGTGRVL